MRTRITAAIVLLVVSPWIAAQTAGPDVYQARRAALLEQLDGGVAILYGAAGHTSSAGTGPFIQDSAFYYLTGVSDPGAALMLDPSGPRYKEILYLRPRDPDVENWDGRRPPLGRALERELGFERVERTTRLPSDLSSALQRSKTGVFLGPIVSANAEIPAALELLENAKDRVPGAKIVNKADLIPEMRRIKEPLEIEMIQRAVDITGKGIVAAMQAVGTEMLEFQLQSVVEHAYEMEGAQFLGFSTIMAWGANATVLHYQSNDDEIRDDGLLLLDTGAAWQHYSADVTRTFPVDGKFSDRELEIYELVLKASDAAIANVKVGADHYQDLHLTAKRVLDDAGYGDYFIHGIGHFLGLDVHDAGDYSKPLEAGVVLTIEPGIYIPEEGIGVRIEDVILVTKDGPVLMSRDIPRTVEAIENAMANRGE